MSSPLPASLSGSYAYSDTLKAVYYGPGSLVTALPKLLNTLAVKKALVLTGKSLYNKTEVVRKVEDVLKQHNAYGATFYEIGEHSPIAGIRKGVELFKQHKADAIVSVGGGSPIDGSKAILYFVQKDVGGAIPPQIAIPTTLSAAEYTIGAGHTNDDGHKVAVGDPLLAPSGIILDAELTLATPERLWLSTGLRALDHAVENLYRPGNPPPIKSLSFGALINLFEQLPKSKADPQDLVARQKLQWAAWMSLFPVKAEKHGPLGLSHAIGHKLGATYRIGHGITSCLTLAAVVKLQAKIASEEDKALLARCNGFCGRRPTGSVEGDILSFADAIDDLVKQLGLKTTLTECNVPREDAAKIAERTVGSKDHPLYLEVVKLVESLY